MNNNDLLVSLRRRVSELLADVDDLEQRLMMERIASEEQQKTIDKQAVEISLLKGTHNANTDQR